MRHLLASLAILLTSSALGQAPPSLPDLSFLIGSWESVSGPPGASGGSQFRYDLNGKVLIRANRATYPASNGRPASTHEDLLILYLQDAPPIRGIYFDSEGHVIRYVATVAAPEQLVLVSEPAPGQPRYQLSYSRTSPDHLAGTFSSAPNEKPEHFTSMFQWQLRRTSPSPQQQLKAP